jgi:hypothetical protein
VKKPLAILVLGLLLTGAGCPTAKPVAAPTPAPVTETPSQPVPGDVNAFAVANGTLSHKAFTIAIPQGASAEGGSFGRIETGDFIVEFRQSLNMDEALQTFGSAFNTRKGSKLAGRTVIFGTDAPGATNLEEQYFAIYNGDVAITVTLFANTKAGMTAAETFVQTIHWTDQN